MVDGKQKSLLVHRKGSTRAFPPHHPLIPVDYQLTGQPVLVGGTMGTCSYVLTGTEKAMTETFGSTCHGAVSNPPQFTRIITKNKPELIYVSIHNLGSRAIPSKVTP